MALVSNVIYSVRGEAAGAGRKKLLVVQFVFDGSYPAKGYALSASTLGLTQIDAIVFSGICISDTADTVCVPCWDAAKGKIMIGEAGADGAGLDDATAATLTTGSNCYAVVVGW